MAARAPIKIKYNLSDQYPLTFQQNYAGASSVLGQRGWRPQLPSQSGVLSVATCALRIGKRLFVGNGNGSAGTAGLRVFNAETGVLETTISFGGLAIVNCLETDGTFVYVGGLFTSCQGIAGVNLAKLNANTLVASPWASVTSVFSGTGEIASIAYSTTQQKLYMASNGANGINGTATGNAFHVVTPAGVVTAGTPSFTGTFFQANTVKVDDTLGFVYVGGGYNLVNATARNCISRLVLTTLAIDAWNPNVTPNVVAMVNVITVVGSLIYVGGSNIANIGGAARNNLACINQAGTATTWNPALVGTGISAITFFSNLLFIGGVYTSIFGVARTNICTVTEAGVTDVKWLPDANGDVKFILGLERTIYCFGQFTTIWGTFQKAQMAVPFPWASPAFSHTANGFDDNNAFFVAKTGSDTNIGFLGVPVKTIAKAITLLTVAKPNIVIQDNGFYSEGPTLSIPNLGIWAEEGKKPTLGVFVGANQGTYGARSTNRTNFPALSGGGLFLYVSKSGNNGTAVRGNINLPYLTIQGAASAVLNFGDVIVIQDSGRYVEDVVGNAFGMTIMAANGQVPTLVNVLTGGANAHFTATGPIKIYGLNIAQLKTGTSSVLSGTTASLIVDCTVSGLNPNLVIAGFSGQTCTVDSCSINSMRLVSGNTTLTLCTNSFFSGCDTPFVMNFTAYTVTSCTFFNSLNNVMLRQTGAGGQSNRIQYCMFDGCLKTSNPTFGTAINDFGGNAIIEGDQFSSGITSTTQCSDNIFKNLDRGGVCVSSSGWTVNRNLFYKNAINQQGTPTFWVYGGWRYNTSDIVFFTELAGPGLVNSMTNNTVSNNTSIGSLCHGITAFAANIGGSPAPNAIQTLSLFNNTVINCGIRALWFSTGPAQFWLGPPAGTSGTINTPTNSAFAETGCPISFFDERTAPAGITFSYMTDALGGNAALGAGSSRVNPQFVSTVSGQEDVSLSATSPALLTGNAAGSISAGAAGALFSITATNVTIDGLILSGVKNVHGGISEQLDMATGSNVKYCTFSSLSHYGTLEGSSGELSNNVFKNFGAGTLLVSGSNVCQRNVFLGNTTAGIVSVFAGSLIQNNSSFNCTYGQYDNVASGYIQRNNIYSESGVFDYFGGGTQNYGDIGTLGPSASVDANSTRLNPLYRDAVNGDLRLQAVAAGSFFDSPALKKADDGNDMGAFSFFYGPLNQGSTILILDSPNRNPDRLIRTDEPIKLFEGVQEDGTTYTGAAAFRIDYTFKWDESASDMPTAQVTALRAMYESSDGRAQIDFEDGNGFIDVFVLRGTAFEYTEMSGIYSSDQMPTPVREVKFRVK